MVNTQLNLKFGYFMKFMSGINKKNICQLANLQIKKFYLHFLSYITDSNKKHIKEKYGKEQELVHKWYFVKIYLQNRLCFISSQKSCYKLNKFFPLTMY